MSLFFVLLSFRETLACDRTKFLFLNDEPVELKYYPFTISLNKCTGSCNVLSPKTCVSKGTKDIYVTAFNMITNKNEAKATTELFSCDCKCKFNRTTCNSKPK